MKTVLVIEDNKKYQTILQETLSEERIHVLTADNGRKALDLVKKEQVDLILLDLLMPDIDGITFYHQLQEVLKKHIPIIVLTNITSAAAYGPDIKEVLIKADVSLEEVVKKVKANLK